MSDMKIYETACIYKLESADGSKIYYGSTCDFKRRMIKHKSDYKRYLNESYHYVSSFDIIKDPGYKCSIIEEFKKISRQDLEKKESEYIQKNNCVNKRQSLTDKEKPEHYKKYQENYYNKNKSKLNEKFSCACGGQFTKVNKSKHEQTKQHKSYIKSLQPVIQNITNNNYYITKSGVKIFIKK
jgi:hypothetical protein